MIYGICISTIHQSYFSITRGIVTYTLLQDFKQGKRHCNSFLVLLKLNMSGDQENVDKNVVWHASSSTMCWPSVTIQLCPQLTRPGAATIDFQCMASLKRLNIWERTNLLAQLFVDCKFKNVQDRQTIRFLAAYNYNKTQEHLEIGH